MAVLICAYGVVFAYAVVSQQLSSMWNDGGGSRHQEMRCTFYCDTEYMDRGSGLSVNLVISFESRSCGFGSSLIFNRHDQVWKYIEGRNRLGTCPGRWTITDAKTLLR
jgi:hypothetical protein